VSLGRTIVGPEAPDELEPIGPRGHREHFGAEPLGELHGNVPHPTDERR
jgi:hypothetical protein